MNKTVTKKLAKRKKKISKKLKNRIMIIVPSIGQCGPVLGAFAFAKYLHAKGFRVFFVSLDENYNAKISIRNILLKNDITHECLNVEGWRGLYKIGKVRKFVESRSIDVIFSYGIRPDITNSFMADIIKIASVRGTISKEYQQKYGKLISRIFTWIHIEALKKMDSVFSMSRGMSEYLVSEGISNSVIYEVNNFVDVNSIRSSVEDSAEANNGKFNIGFFGNFLYRKRIDTILKAFSLLKTNFKYDKILLHLIGHGPLVNQMKAFTKELNIDNMVIFYGFCSEPLKIMNKMDVVVIASESEGTPRVLMEAMSLGKTCIGTDIDGVNELIANNKTGYLFPVGNYDRLANLLHQIYKDKMFVPSERLVNFMQNNYDVEPCCEKILQQINRLLESKRKVQDEV